MQGLYMPLHYAARNGHSEIVSNLLSMTQVKDAIDSQTEVTTTNYKPYRV